jgi:hypothetical protein
MLECVEDGDQKERELGRPRAALSQPPHRLQPDTHQPVVAGVHKALELCNN